MRIANQDKERIIKEIAINKANGNYDKSDITKFFMFCVNAYFHKKDYGGKRK